MDPVFYKSRVVWLSVILYSISNLYCTDRFLVTNVKNFGAKGDGVTFDDHSIIEAFQSINEIGGTLYFPKGKYRIGKGKAVVFENAKNIRFVGNQAVLFCDTITGDDGEVIAFRSSAKNITFDSLIFYNESNSPNSFDNMLTFSGTAGEIENISINECVFRSSSNKQIHFGGNTIGVRISRCEFINSCYNVAPLAGWNSFGAIFFLWSDSSRFSNISISNNIFKNNNVYCISLNQWEDTIPPMFHNVVIENNIFESSSYGIVARGIENLQIAMNTFANVGSNFLNNNYLFDSSLMRYISKKRKKANQRPLTITTAKFERMPVIYVSNSSSVNIKSNRYSYCLSSQPKFVENIGDRGITVKRSTAVSVVSNIFFEKDSIIDDIAKKIIFSDKNTSFEAYHNKYIFSTNLTEIPIKVTISN